MHTELPPIFRDMSAFKDAKGNIKYNILRPAIEQFVRHWGYYDKEICCLLFTKVAQLFQGPDGSSSLPTKKGKATANAKPIEVTANE